MAASTTFDFEDRRRRERRASRSIGVLTFFGPAPLPNTKYRLRDALTVHIQIDEGPRYVVSEPVTGAFTSDDDLGRAVSGFMGAFVEEFEFLLQRESSLSPALTSDLERFRNVIEGPAQ
jgi:hypothetical protein